MYRHFRIFSKGLERSYFHFLPFSKCNKLKSKIEFVEWKDIAGFEKSSYYKAYSTIYLRLNLMAKRVQRRMIWTYTQRRKVGKEVIGTLEDFLRKNNVKEIHSSCPKCGYEVPNYIPEICPKCKIKRY